jgi:hypothetical protein
MPFARLPIYFALSALGGGAFAEDASNRVAIVIGNSACSRAARLIAAKPIAQYNGGERAAAISTFAAS